MSLFRQEQSSVLDLIHQAVHAALQHAMHHHGRRSHHSGGHPASARHPADGSTVEDLEQRVLMSSAHPTNAPELFAKSSAAHVTVSAKAKSTAAAASATSNPVAIADPKVTDKSYTYVSFANKPLFGSTGPNINDVTQGNLGDCFLLSVLSSVAKSDPALIRKMIVANSNGTFTVNFARKPIVIDADLAVTPDGRPAYAQLGANNSLWVALIEKAFADYADPKSNRYETIEGGWMGDAFTALGLKSTSTFDTSSAKSLATQVQKGLKSHSFVTMGTSSYVGNDSPFVSGHAYEIDSVTLNKKGVVISVTLRNPWGNALATGGYVTVTPEQMFNAFAGLATSHG